MRSRQARGGEGCDQWVGVFIIAALEDQDRSGGEGGVETGGEDAAGRAAAEDDVVVFRLGWHFGRKKRGIELSEMRDWAR